MPDDPRLDPPTTLAGRALIGWARPNLRAGILAAVRSIETEAGKSALTSFRERVAGSSSPAAEELVRLIDDAIAESEAHPDR